MTGSVLSDGSAIAPHRPVSTRIAAGLRVAAPTGRKRSKITLQKRLPALIRIADFAGLAGIGFAIDTPFAWHEVRPLTHSLGIGLAAIATINCLQALDGYCTTSLPKRNSQFAKASFAWICGFSLLLTFSYFTERSQEFLTLWAWLWFASAWAFLLLLRAMVAARLSRWQRQGQLVRNIAVLGTGTAALKVGQHLRHRVDEVNVVGVFIDGADSTETTNAAANSDILVDMATAGEVDEIIVVLPWSSPIPLNQVIGKFAASQVEIRIEPGLPLTDFPPQDFTSICGVPTLTVQRRPLSGWGAPLKRVEDLALALIVMLIALPILLLIAVAVKIDSRGPVFFRQERYGFDNNRIMVLKFRSMHHEPSPDPSVPQARRNDPRITRVGSILRRTSLDELPQLFNVLRGEMSLIGPRPHAAAHNQKYAKLIDGYLARHRMKPGITGWAQVNGLRGETETLDQMRHRLEHDLYYIANWSLLLDVKILLMTLPVVVRGTNAY